MSTDDFRSEARALLNRLLDEAATKLPHAQDELLWPPNVLLNTIPYARSMRFALLRRALLLTKPYEIRIVATHTADWPTIRRTIVDARLPTIGTVLNRAFQSVEISVFQ